uniref:Uncharacterized protein n=1 Tax=viral metagenome TaxID=1070528 RepID=A0A6C0IND0_9ZZZZ
MSSENEQKLILDEQTAKNKTVPKGTVIETKVFPSEFSGDRSYVAKSITSVRKKIPSSSSMQQVDYYLNQLKNYIYWATSSDPDPLKGPSDFFPSVKRTITFQAAKPTDDKKGGKKYKKNNGRKTKKGSRTNKNKTRKHK